MKKLLLSAAMLLATSAAFAQPNANSNSNSESDKVDVLAKVKICDLIDLAPECQVACAEVCDWDDFTDYTCLKEFTPGTPQNPFGNDDNLEFRVSANRKFKVSVKGEDFQGPHYDKLEADNFVLKVQNGAYGSGVNNFYALNGFGGFAGADLPKYEKDILQGTGGYNKLFIVKICLKPYKAFDHKPGEYCANIKFKAYLCD